MAADATWNPIASPCDYILLANTRSPGVADVVGAGSPRKWDKRDGIGLSGSFSVFTGRDLAEFSVRLRLYSESDWADWYAWKPLVDKMPTKRTGKGKDSGVMDIWHPFLEALDIKSVAVVDTLQPEQTGDGEWTIEIKFIEWRQPKVALATPEGAAADPVDPVEEQIGRLTNAFNVARLAGEVPPLPVPP